MIYFSFLKPFGGMFFSANGRLLVCFSSECYYRWNLCTGWYSIISFHLIGTGFLSVLEDHSFLLSHPQVPWNTNSLLSFVGLDCFGKRHLSTCYSFSFWRMLSDHWFYLAEFRNSDSNLFSKLFSISWSVDLCEFFNLVFYICRADTDLPKWFLPSLCRHQNFLSYHESPGLINSLGGSVFHKLNWSAPRVGLRSKALTVWILSCSSFHFISPRRV